MKNLHLCSLFLKRKSGEITYDSAVAASVSFAGPFSGNLIMVVSGQILPELTGNMLGVDDNAETTLEQRHDALKELINVICGNLLPTIAGKHSIFNVNAPVILPGERNLILKTGENLYLR